MTKILVTGAAGAIGRETVRALRDRGLSVRAAARSPERARELEALGAEIVPLDFGDSQSVARAFAGIDRAFLITPFVEHFEPMVEVGVAAGARGRSEVHLAHVGTGEPIRLRPRAWLPPTAAAKTGSRRAASLGR